VDILSCFAQLFLSLIEGCALSEIQLEKIVQLRNDGDYFGAFEILQKVIDLSLIHI